MNKLLRAPARGSVCFTASALSRMALKPGLQWESCLLNVYFNPQSEPRGNFVCIFVGTGILVKILGACLLPKRWLCQDLSCHHGALLYPHGGARLWLASSHCILAKLKCSTRTSCSRHRVYHGVIVLLVVKPKQRQNCHSGEWNRRRGRGKNLNTDSWNCSYCDYKLELGFRAQVACKVTQN